MLSLKEGAKEGWPTLEALASYGVAILRAKQPRVAKYAGVRYVEGGLEYSLRGITDDLFESEGRSRPNKTERFRLH